MLYNLLKLIRTHFTFFTMLVYTVHRPTKRRLLLSNIKDLSTILADILPLFEFALCLCIHDISSHNVRLLAVLVKP